jgi:hypothetical protein
VEDVLDGKVVVVLVATLETGTGEDEKVETLEKMDADVVGELEKVEMFDEIGKVRSLDGGSLSESGAADLASAVVPLIPNVKVLVGFASANSLLTDAAIDEPTLVLEPKLNAGDGVDEAIAELLLATANMEVDGAELRSGLSAGVCFGDDENEKPLLRLGVDAGLVGKWSGAFSVVDGADGDNLSDD